MKDSGESLTENLRKAWERKLGDLERHFGPEVPEDEMMGTLEIGRADPSTSAPIMLMRDHVCGMMKDVITWPVDEIIGERLLDMVKVLIP